MFETDVVNLIVIQQCQDAYNQDHRRVQKPLSSVWLFGCDLPDDTLDFLAPGKLFK